MVDTWNRGRMQDNHPSGVLTHVLLNGSVLGRAIYPDSKPSHHEAQESRLKESERRVINWSRDQDRSAVRRFPRSRASRLRVQQGEARH